MENRINTKTKSRENSGAACIDTQALKELVGDDPQQMKEILQASMEPLKDMVGEIRIAYEQHSFEGIRRGAHKLYSGARSIGAHDLADLCQELETAGERGDWAVIDNGAPQLESLMLAIEDHINRL